MSPDGPPETNHRHAVGRGGQGGVAETRRSQWRRPGVRARNVHLPSGFARWGAQRKTVAAHVQKGAPDTQRTKPMDGAVQSVAYANSPQIEPGIRTRQ